MNVQGKCIYPLSQFQYVIMVVLHHPSIFFRSIGIKSRWHQSKQRCTDFPVMVTSSAPLRGTQNVPRPAKRRSPSRVSWVFFLVLHQMGHAQNKDMVFPACPGSFLGPLHIGTCSEDCLRNVSHEASGPNYKITNYTTCRRAQRGLVQCGWQLKVYLSSPNPNPGTWHLGHGTYYNYRKLIISYFSISSIQQIVF